MSTLKHFVEASWLNEHLHDDKLFIIDCRFDLFDPAEHGKRSYAQDMIEGAYYFDMDEDLSENRGEHGGRRATPDPEILGAKLAAVGICMDSTIVCYDDGVYSAPRAWWQLRYMGYEKVYVLNGGITQWRKLGYPLGTQAPAPRGQGTWTARLHPEMFADKDYVKAALEKEAAEQNDTKTLLVDSRAYERYTGEYEPLYSKKGHIPGAISVHYLTNMQAESEGTLIGTPQQWRRNLAACLDAQEVIFYCGSGIEACINLMFLAELGKDARLYVGSMSDWVSYDDVEVESFVR